MNTLLLKKWFTAFLTIFGLISPAAIATLPEPALMISTPAQTARVVPAVKPDITSAPMHSFEQSYTCVFAGKALLKGGPSANTQVEIRLTSSDAILTARTVTTEDGSYTLSIPMAGEPRQAVHWEISALTPDMQKASAEGHQILTDEPSINLDVPLNVLPS